MLFFGCMCEMAFQGLFHKEEDVMNKMVAMTALFFMVLFCTVTSGNTAWAKGEMEGEWRISTSIQMPGILIWY